MAQGSPGIKYRSDCPGSRGRSSRIKHPFLSCLPLTELSFRRSIMKPFLERGVHSGLPAWSTRAKSREYVLIEADGDLLFGGFPAWSTCAANRGDRSGNAATPCDRSFSPVQIWRSWRWRHSRRSGSGDFGGAKWPRSNFRLACGWHSGMILDTCPCSYNRSLQPREERASVWKRLSCD